MWVGHADARRFSVDWTESTPSILHLSHSLIRSGRKIKDIGFGRKQEPGKSNSIGPRSILRSAVESPININHTMYDESVDWKLILVRAWTKMAPVVFTGSNQSTGGVQENNRMTIFNNF